VTPHSTTSRFRKPRNQTDLPQGVTPRYAESTGIKVAETLRSLGDHLQLGRSVRNVYGDPVIVGGRTVIPIARVSYGFGAGGGVNEGEKAKSKRGGSGGGAGMSARPAGDLEITEAGTRFFPFVDPARLGIALTVGLLVGLGIGRRSARKRSVVG